MALEPFKIPALGLWLARLWRTVIVPVEALTRWRPEIRKAWERFTDFSKRHYLKPVYMGAALLSPFWMYLVYLAFDKFVDLLTSPASVDPDAERASLYSLIAIVTAFGAVLSPPFILIRIWVNERQARTAEQGHITDRITKAVEQLGAEKTVKKVENGKTVEFTEPNLEVRLGALYALERIAQDSERDHIPIMETLCAYIRENSNARKPKDLNLAPWEKAPEDADEESKARRQIEWDLRFGNGRGTSGNLDDWIASIPKPRADVKAALTIIGRRREPRRLHERRVDNEYRLDLRGANLQRVDLSGAELAHGRMQRCRFEGADFSWAEMRLANLSDAQMQKVDLGWADLEGAHLNGAQMHKADCMGTKLVDVFLLRAEVPAANFWLANMQGAFLKDTKMPKACLSETLMQGASLTGADLKEADFRASKLSTAKLYLAAFAGANARSVDFSEAEGLTQEQVNSLFGDLDTILPEGLHRTSLMDREPLESPASRDPEYHAWLAAGAPPGKPLENA